MKGAAAIPEWAAPTLASHLNENRYGFPFEEFLLRYVPAECYSRLGELGFIILKPDAIASGAASGILSMLTADLGMSIMAMSVTSVSVSRFNRLYHDSLPDMGHLVWLHHELFKGGPAACVVLHGEPGKFSSLSHRLSAMKGSSHPLAADEKALRGRFGRTSAINMLLHIADDVGNFLCQSTLFFDGRDLAGIYNRDAGISEEVWRVMIAVEPPPGTTVFQAHLHIKRRVLAKFMSMPHGRELENLLVPLWALLLEVNSNLSGLPYSGQRAEFRLFTKLERPLMSQLIHQVERDVAQQFTSLIAVPGDTIQARLTQLKRLQDLMAALYSSWCLSGNEPYSLDDCTPLLLALAGADVPLSQELQTLVSTGLLLDVNPRARWSGVPIYPEVISENE